MALIDLERVVSRVYNRVLGAKISESRANICLADVRNRLHLHRGRYFERSKADLVAEIDAALVRIDAIEAEWNRTRRKKPVQEPAFEVAAPRIITFGERKPKLVHGLLWETSMIDEPPDPYAGTGRKPKPYAGEADYTTRNLSIPGYGHAARIVQARRLDQSVLDKIAARTLEHGIPNLVTDHRFIRYIWDADATEERNYPRLFELAKTGP